MEAASADIVLPECVDLKQALLCEWKAPHSDTAEQVEMPSDRWPEIIGDLRPVPTPYLNILISLSIIIMLLGAVDGLGEGKASASLLVCDEGGQQGSAGPPGCWLPLWVDRNWRRHGRVDVASFRGGEAQMEWERRVRMHLRLRVKQSTWVTGGSNPTAVQVEDPRRHVQCLTRHTVPRPRVL